MGKTMVTIISCLNLKGGCGKTSSIVNLGGILSEKKLKPLLIDLDEQRSATHWAEQGGEKFPYPVIPISLESASQFKKEIDRLAKEHDANIILIDTPPQLEDDALIAALLSDVVLIPVSPSPLDLWAAKQAVKMIKEAREERGGELPKVILIPSRVMSRTSLARDIKGSLKEFGEPVSPAISLRVAVAESGIAGLPVGHYAPKSPSHKEFANLWKFVNTNIRK
jgi:chromosome partitioning protein